MTQKQLHVLVSSTRQWNPGDEFIDRGVRNILSPFLSNEDSWHLWNRNPDLSVHPDRDWSYRTDFVSNNVSKLLQQLIDVVVFSGSPEWLGPRCEAIYDFLDQSPSIPLLLLGVGSASPLYNMRDVEKRVLSRDNTLIITRSRDLALQINNMLGFHKSSWLPCPAVLSSSQLDRDHGNKRIAAILQIPHGPQPISQSHFDDIRRYLAETQAEVDVIAFHEAECEYLARNFPDRRLRYSERAETYLSWFNQYGAVVSTRLHGALAAMSSGSWACIFQRDDFRVNSTAELVTPVHVLPPSSAIDAAIAALSSTSELQMEVYLFKQEVMLQYQQKLVPFMKTVRAF